MPAQVTDNKDTTCTVSFTPRVVGEHRISVTHRNLPVLGSPFGCKVYDVAAIKVKDSPKGVIGLPVTFLGKPFLVSTVMRNYNRFVILNKKFRYSRFLKFYR